MKKEKFIVAIADILQAEETINEKTKLEDFNYDSLVILELIVLKEKEFPSLKIDPDKFTDCKTVKDLMKLFKINE
jgi:acyl carrier protein|tara:strand:- start:111 stop:335 length:225 start_codon:yes stop_codon:yes gene_type:complete